MSENGIYDLIIVGGGPGGLSAGIYAMRAALKTILIEKGLTGGQINLTESVENYPGFENISGFDLSQKFLQHAKSYGLESDPARGGGGGTRIGFHRCGWPMASS